MRDKIPCGGFYLDDTLKVDENNVLGLAPGAGGVQSDWNVNDESNLAYVKNRTHYEEDVVEDITGNTYNIFVTKDVSSVTHDEIPFELGQMYTVVAKNGESVRKQWTDMEVQQGEDGTLYIGNNENVNTTYPFYITSENAVVNLSFIDQLNLTKIEVICTSGSVTKHVVHQLGQKFIPSELFKVTFTTEDVMTYTVDKTFEEIIEAYNNGKFVYGKVEMRDFSWFLYLNDIDEDIAIFTGDAMDGKIHITISVGKNSEGTYGKIDNTGLYLPSPSGSASSNKYKLVRLNANNNYELSSDIIIPSSTSGSSKYFKITVDDSGTLSTTEVT